MDALRLSKRIRTLSSDLGEMSCSQLPSETSYPRLLTNDGYLQYPMVDSLDGVMNLCVEHVA